MNKTPFVLRTFPPVRGQILALFSPSLEKEGRGGWKLNDIRNLIPLLPVVEARKTKKLAFTLAEVLITLGIIGIVAALTIPGLITKYHRRSVEVKLEKFYSTINQAIRYSIADHGDISFDNDAAIENRAQYIEEWFKENFLQYLSGAHGELLSKNSVYYKIELSDGSGFVSYIPTTGGGFNIFYCVNANDKSCKPESYDAKNTFLFVYHTRKRSIVPLGYDILNTDTLKFNPGNMVGCYLKSSSDNKHLCTSLIFHNGWKIPDDYPWIK